MRTLEDEIESLIAVDLAVLKPHQKRGFLGLDQYRRAVQVRGVPEVAATIANSFGAFAIFDVETVLRYPAITPFVAQALYAIPIELRREACDRDRSKAARARNEMARIMSAALLQRYHFERLKHTGTSCHDWNRAFENKFGSRRGKRANER